MIRTSMIRGQDHGGLPLTLSLGGSQFVSQ